MGERYLHSILWPAHDVEEVGTMMTHEETKVLAYLRTHLIAPIDEITRACFPGISHEQAGRILWQLEWLGYIVRFGQEAVQITSRGTSVP